MAAREMQACVTLHGERLSRARLTVREYGAVEAVEDGLYELSKCLVVQVALLRTETAGEHRVFYRCEANIGNFACL